MKCQSHDDWWCDTSATQLLTSNTYVYMIHIFFYYSIKTFRQKSFFPIVQVSKIIISDEIFIRTCTKSGHENRRSERRQSKRVEKKAREKKRIVKKKFYSLLGLIGFNWVPSNSNCLRLTFQTGRSVQYHIRCMVPNLTPEPEKLEIFVGVSKFAAVSIMRERGKKEKERKEERGKWNEKRNGVVGGTFVPRMENR